MLKNIKIIYLLTSKVKSSGQYDIYENQLNLPSVKVTNNLYNSKLKTPIDREHAMLKSDCDSNGKDFNSQSKNLLKHARITTKNIKSKGNNQLEVKNNIGIVNIHIPKNP